MKGALALLGHFALMAIAWRLDMMEKRFLPTLGDPNTLFLGIFFLYWATLFFIAWRSDGRGWLFGSKRGGGWQLLVVSTVFGLTGFVFFVMGLLPQNMF